MSSGGGGGGATTTPQQKKEMEKQALYVELNKCVQNQDDERAAKVASKILHSFPNDDVAFLTKVVAQINRGMFAETLNFINENPKLSSDCQYEKAYCFYRLQRMEEAQAVLDVWDEDSERRNELMYQIKYRLDVFEEAYDILMDLIKNSDDEQDAERQTNLSAIEASLKLAKSEKRVHHVEGDSYELLYNHAVGLIGEGNLKEAEVVLQRAEKLARESLQEEGVTEEDMIDELGLIQVQIGYCIQRLGRVKESLGVYSKVLKDKPTDNGLIAVLSNNVLCGNKDCSIFDSKKRLRAMTIDEVLPKLNKMQKRDMLLNECLFALHIHHVEDTKRLCNLLEERYPELVDDVMVIRCCLKCWTDNIVVTRQEFITPLPKGSPIWLRISLSLIQLPLENGYIDPAIDFMEQLEDHYYRPGIISAVVSLYYSRGMIDKAGAVLSEAVDYYRKSGTNKDNLKLLWRQTASFMMAQGDFVGAAKSLEDLRKIASDPLILAQLIVAYSQFNVDQAIKLSGQLPPIAPKDINVTALESPNWMAQVKLMRKVLRGGGDAIATTPGKTAPDTKEKIKKKKKRKTKLPVNYDKDRQPDPERWLPKYERTGYRPKKTRKGRTDVGKGTQGADSASMAIYDMSSKISQKGQTPTEESPSNPSAWRKDHNKKKKRKK